MSKIYMMVKIMGENGLVPLSFKWSQIPSQVQMKSAMPQEIVGSAKKATQNPTVITNWPEHLSVPLKTKMANLLTKYLS